MHATPHERPVEIEAPYVAEMVRQAMVVQYGDEAYTRGLNVTTSLRANEQQAAYRAVRQGVLDFERRQIYRGPELFINLPPAGPARDEAVDEAFAGDIIGFTTHGGVQLGDTITDGANLQFTGLPFFAPELFMTVILKNPLRTKQLQTGLDQLGEEGAIQVFKPEIGGPMLLGAVGQLQFEVVQHRLKAEYDCDVRLEGCQYTGARWITADTPAELREFTNAYPQRMSLDAAGTLAYLCTSPYDVRLAQERFPKIHFHPLREHAGLALQRAG